MANKKYFMSNVIINTGKICLIILCVVALILDILYVYFRYIDPSKTITINNIGNQVAIDTITDAEGLTDEEKRALENRTLFTVNMYDNTNKNGIFLGEMQMNYFMSYNLSTTDYRSSGVQWAINIELFEKEVDLFKVGYNSNYDNMYSIMEYETTDGVSWNGKIEEMSIATALERDKEYIIKIDNQPYSIILNGTYTKSEPLWGFLWNVENTYNYNFQDLFLLLLQATQTNSKGVGTRYLQIDLSEFFTVKKFNSETGVFEPQQSDIVKNYCVVKINYSKNGAVSSNQSLFNIIANNPSFDVDNNEISTEYWNATITYDLSDSDLSYRYSELYQGYFVSASQDLIVKFANMPSSKIDVVINLDSDFIKNHNYNIIGLDYNAFQNLKLNSLTIKSEELATLTLLDYCLADTNIKTLNYTNTITLIKSNTAINNDCVEVVL